MVKSDNISSLDFLRASSALTVAWGHSRFLIIVPSAEVESISVINQLIYFLAGFGPQAVIIFFVLSGFFIARSIEARISINKFCLKDYFTDRYFRLSTVAIPAVILTLILDIYAIFFFGKSEFYYQRLDWLDNSSFSLQTFIGNLFYLQTVFFNSFGSNGPLWSLAYEWWFYVMAPFILIPIRLKKTKLLFLFAFVAIFLFYINFKILIYFIYWLFGALIFYVAQKPDQIRLNLNVLIVATSVLLFVSASITRLRFVDKIFGDCLISISVALLIYFLVKKNYKIENKALTILTNISYSLYAIHLPILIFMISFFKYFENKLQPTLFNSFLGFIFLFITICLSYLFWFTFEKNTNYFKGLFKKNFK